MADAKTIKKPADNYVDPWTTDKSTWVYVSIPEENALGYKHDSLSINRHVFEPGKTYTVPMAIAETLKERLKVYARATIRTLQPRRDIASENQVAIGSANAGGTAVDPTTLV